MNAFRTLAGILVFAAVVPTPSMACGDIPALGAAIDRLMATGDAQKAYPDIEAERARIAHLGRSGENAQARRLEEDAMRALGFEKLWLRCGEGTFMWIRIDHKNRMVGPAPDAQKRDEQPGM